MVSEQAARAAGADVVLTDGFIRTLGGLCWLHRIPFEE
jgi:hypothetical protein